jgi:hypothetical protein
MKGENYEQLQVVSSWVEGRGRRAGDRCAGRRVWLIWKPNGRNFDHGSISPSNEAKTRVKEILEAAMTDWAELATFLGKGR